MSAIFSIFNFIIVLKYERYEFLDSFTHFLDSLIHFLDSFICSLNTHFIVSGTDLGAKNTKYTKLLSSWSLLSAYLQIKYISKYTVYYKLLKKKKKHNN